METPYVIQSSNQVVHGPPYSMTILRDGIQYTIRFSLNALVGTDFHLEYTRCLLERTSCLTRMGEMTQDNIRFSSLFKIEGALKDLIWAECKLVIETYGAEDGLGPLNLQDFFQPPSVHIAIVKSDSDRGTIAKVEADHTNSYPWDTSYATDHSSDMRNSYGWGTAPVLMNELHIDTTNVQLFKARELFTVMAAEQTCAMQQVHSSSGEKFFFKPRMDLMAPEFDREASVLGTMISLDLHKTLRVSPFIGFVLLDNGLVTGMLFDWLEGSPLAETPQLGDQQLHKIWHDQVQATVDELHRHNIIWGDVNVRNIFIDTNDDAWVIDFGGNCNVQFVDEELKETYDGDRQGLRRIFEDWLPSKARASEAAQPL